MKKAAVLIFTLALLMMFAAVAPALATGPWKALEVGNNPNLWVSLGALHNLRGEAGGALIWAESPAGFWVKWSFFDAVSGQGKANNAIVANFATLVQFSTDAAAYANGGPTVNENKWIYLSPEGSGNQYLGHGMIWCLFYFGFNDAAVASYVASMFPNGAFWMYNFIQ